MYIKKLKLNNFRNYTDEEIFFTDGLNVLTGDNAQGKTNCAEAIFYLCTGYSPRAGSDKQVVRYGESSACIDGTAVGLYGEVNVLINFFAKDKKKVKVNGVEISKIGEILGNIHSVFFNPLELKLIQESPEDRRRFLDISLSQISKSYFYSLQRYKKILTQRNNLLKDTDIDVVRETIPVWDKQLVISASEIIEARNEYVKILRPLSRDAHAYITDGKEMLDVKCENKWTGSKEEIQSALLSDLQERLEKDIVLGYTTVGPHRDDLKIKVNGEDVRCYGSQGQQRTCALSLKLAETEIFKKYFGEYPVLILDDAMSELDKDRQKRLLERVKNLQTVITCTHVDEDVFGGSEYNHVKISNGKVVNND